MLQFSQIVKIFELPYMSRQRIDLLNANRTYLHFSMSMILMILPQGKAFQYLKKRIQFIKYSEYFKEDLFQISQFEIIEEGVEA